MKKTKASRWARRPFKAAVTVLTLAILLASYSSDTSVPGPLDRAAAPGEEISLERWARWVVRGPEAPSGILWTDLEAANSAEERRYSLFSRDEAAALVRDLPYGETLVEAASRHGLDGLLLAAIVEHESAFDPTSVSPRGAVGLMQLLPATGRAYGAEDLFDPGVNIDVGSRYLSYLLDLYEGDLDLALAAYNAGPAAVARYGGVPPYRETRRYVERVKAQYEELKKRVNRA
jgi:soluble lytic murein transglycosylase-like protein